MIFKFYLKLFLQISICFGIFTGLIDYDSEGKDIFSAVVTGFFFGLIYGFLMTAYIAYSHTKAVRKIPNSTDEDIVKSRQIRAIYVCLNQQQATDMCVLAFKEISATLLSKSGNGNLFGQTGMSWKSFGETISFRIISNGYRSSITVTSSSRFGAEGVGVDYGVNLINVNRLETFILREASKFTAHLPSSENTELLSVSAFENLSVDSARI